MDQSVWKRVRETWLSHRPSPFAGLVAALSVLAVVIGAVCFWQGFFHADQWMAASRELVFHKKEIWRLWTTLFAHADTGHLLSNLLLFFIMGYLLVGYFGAWVFPWAALLFGGITNFFVLMNYPEEVQLIGASGVVYWLGGAWLALYFMLDQKRSYVQRALRAGGVALGVFMPTSAFDPSISYSAHLIGFVLGVGFGFAYYFVRREEFKKAIVYEYIFTEEDVLSSPANWDTDDNLSHPNAHGNRHSPWN